MFQLCGCIYCKNVCVFFSFLFYVACLLARWLPARCFVCGYITRPACFVAVTQTLHVYILYILCLRACEVM